jgi:osmotically-inducible protein OsmY
MALADAPDAYLAEQVRDALALDPRLHELGIRVTVLTARRRVVLAGVVANGERRGWAEEVARRTLPEFEVHNDLGVQRMAQPEPETLA